MRSRLLWIVAVAVVAGCRTAPPIQQPAALDSLGWVRYRQGDSKTALVTLERAYYISHDSEIAAHWGEAIWASGDHNQARKVWAAALAREPDSQQLKATLARFLPDAK